MRASSSVAESSSRTSSAVPTQRSPTEVLLSASDFISELFSAIDASRRFHPSTARKAHPPSSAKVWISVFSAPDPDSICAVHLLQSGLVFRLGLDLHLIVVASYAQLQHTLAQADSQGPGSPLTESVCFVFINMGGRRDIRHYLPSHSTRRLFIFDSHRPLAPSYISVATSPIIVTTHEEFRTIEQQMMRLKKHRQRSTQGIDAASSDDDDADDDIAFDEFHEYAPSQGEYFVCPVSVIVFEALQAQSFDEPCCYFVTATGLAFCQLVGIITPADYHKYMSDFCEQLNRSRQRYKKFDRRYTLIQATFDDLVLPLFRFTSLQHSLRHSLMFLRTQPTRLWSADAVQENLAHLRVELGFKEANWNEDFRLLRPQEQAWIENHQLPKIIQYMTLDSRQRLRGPYPDHEELIGLITAPVFCRSLRVVGLPSKLTSLDFGLLLLGLVTRQDLQSSLDSAATHQVDKSCLFCHDDSFFCQGLELLQSLLQGGSSLMAGVIYIENCDPNPKGCNAQPWDAYVPLQTYSSVLMKSDVLVMKSIMSLTQIVLELHQMSFSLVLELLAQRRASNSAMFRRGAWNVEGYMTKFVPTILFNPPWLQYIASMMSDIIAKGVQSASPSIVLFAGCKDDNDTSNGLVITFKPGSVLVEPSLLGYHLHEHLRTLRYQGTSPMFASYGFDASKVYVPSRMLRQLFDCLFPLEASPPNDASSSSSDDSDTSSENNESDHETSGQSFEEHETTSANPGVSAQSDKENHPLNAMSEKSGPLPEHEAAGQALKGKRRRLKRVISFAESTE